jgi:hypothetical protein
MTTSTAYKPRWVLLGILPPIATTITVRCKECGCRNRLERTRTGAEDIWLICSECETLLYTEHRP